VYRFGSCTRSRCISVTLSSGKRGRSNLGRASGGGKAQPVAGGGDITDKSGEEGLTVYENGVNAEGGER
jgi:hypothetical protein